MPTEDFSGFDEAKYLESRQDLVRGLEKNKYASPLEHFIKKGHHQNGGELYSLPDENVGFEVDECVVSEDGFIFLVGWCADLSGEIFGIQVNAGPYSCTFGPEEIFRSRRLDVEEALKVKDYSLGYNFGFFIASKVQHPHLLRTNVRFIVNTSAGRSCRVYSPTFIPTRFICSRVLSYLNSLDVYGDQAFALFEMCDRGLWDVLSDMYKCQTETGKAFTLTRYNERQAEVSLLTVVFGLSAPIRIQSELFAREMPRDYEWIFVNNSPEMAAVVEEKARVAASLHDLQITVVQMSGNIGFGAANNIAASIARGRTLCILNPDVLPHSTTDLSLVRDISPGIMQGAVLHYSDGSVMHNGMYLESDLLFSNGSQADSRKVREGIRVEHFDKGTPAEVPLRDRTGETEAVTGAVMVCDKNSFQEVGGFAEAFMFGHYEDADLCLRWRRKFGAKSVIVNRSLRFVHLEGQGSSGNKESFRGAAKLNRWMFTKRVIQMR